MKILKYIIKSDGTPLLFDSKIMHSEVVKIGISAGFVIVDYDSTINDFKVKCYGGSESLGVKVRDIDCKIIHDYLNELLSSMKFNSTDNSIY